jgi:hypothetical protein
MFELNEDIKEILGKPNFTCINIATILRSSGEDIKEKSEDEQACVIYFLLEMYEKHGKDWREKGNEHLKKLANDALDLVSKEK